MHSSRCNSYYTATINRETDYPRLQDSLTCDIAIVGGGFTGVSIALELAERGYSVALLEANKIGWGATGRNGGQVTGSLSGDNAMTKQFRNCAGVDAGKFVWNFRWRGHDIIASRVKKYDIDCDLKYGHLQTAYKASHLKELQAMYEEAATNGMGEQVKLISRNEMPDYLDSPLYHGALLNRRNMHLHPLNLCIGEARAAESLGARIFENTLVLDIKDTGDLAKIVTERGQVKAGKVVLAGNAYHRLGRSRLRGMLFPASLGNCATVQLDESVALAINPHDLAVYDCRFVLDYYRLTADKRLMFGGGTNYSGKHSNDVAAEMRPAIERTFPRLKGIKIEFDWTCTAGIVINRIPQAGKVSQNVYYCQGYSGHGIASSHIMGEIVAEAIHGNVDEFNMFASVKHIRIPMNEWFGNQMLVLGMMYYRLRENFR